MNNAQRIAELKAELKALEEEARDPIFKRGQDILDIMYPDSKTWRENEKCLPSSYENGEYSNAKCYYVDENVSNKYRVIGFMYIDNYYGREEETEVEVPKSFFETDNLKEEIYKYFFEKNKEEAIGSIQDRLKIKERDLENLKDNIEDLKEELEAAKKEWGYE